MEQTPIRAVEMVRAIRDKIYEETKDLSREDLKEYYARKAEALRQKLQHDSKTDERAPVAGARARR